jgi:hypothetical protein
MYVPTTPSVFNAAYTGALAGIAINGSRVTDPLAIDYTAAAGIAGAFAEAVDAAFSGGVDQLNVGSINTSAVEFFASFSPSPQGLPTYSVPATWTKNAIAIVAIAAAAEAFFTSQGIVPLPLPGGGGGITQLTGDVTAGPGVGVQAATVVKVNGATVPAAGALTTGNALQVTGVSALGYAPINLAGGANFVTGTLPVGNLPALGGDATGTVSAVVVVAVHGATVPIAGALTTGNVPQVTGASALSYGPVNLAGGANFVTGTLPVGNLPAMGGDTTGTVSANTNVRATGNVGGVFAITSPVTLGATPAATGQLRLPNATGILARNAANSGDLILVSSLGSNSIEIGTDAFTAEVDVGGASTAVIQLGPGAGAAIVNVGSFATAGTGAVLADASGHLSKLTPGGGTLLLTSTAGVVSWAAAGASGITQLTGDVVAGPGSGSQAATVNQVTGAVGGQVPITNPIAVNTATGPTATTGMIRLPWNPNGFAAPNQIMVRDATNAVDINIIDASTESGGTLTIGAHGFGTARFDVTQIMGNYIQLHIDNDVIIDSSGTEFFDLTLSTLLIGSGGTPFTIQQKANGGAAKLFTVIAGAGSAATAGSSVLLSAGPGGTTGVGGQAQLTGGFGGQAGVAGGSAQLLGAFTTNQNDVLVEAVDLSATRRVVALCKTGAPGATPSLTSANAPDGDGIIFIHKAQTSPTVATTVGGSLYVDTATGNLMFIGTSGAPRIVALA